MSSDWSLSFLMNSQYDTPFPSTRQAIQVSSSDRKVRLEGSVHHYYVTQFKYQDSTDNFKTNRLTSTVAIGFPTGYDRLC